MVNVAMDPLGWEEQKIGEGERERVRGDPVRLKHDSMKSGSLCLTIVAS